MNTKLSLTIMTIILLIGLAGCGTIDQSHASTSDNSSSQGSSSGAITDTTATDNYQMLPIISGKVADMKLDASADGTTQKIKKGEVMSITLESNASTGYAWFASISDTAVLVQMGDSEYSEPSASSTPIVGAPGTQTFYFQAVETGTAKLTLDYKRGWETDVAPDKTMVITVEVQ